MNDNQDFVIENGVLIKYKGPGGDVTIPEGVTEIADGGYQDGVFYLCKNLTNVTIPEGVTKIGWNAFYGCTGLTSVTLPRTVTKVGHSAFSTCKLTSVTMWASSLTEASSGMFGSNGKTIPMVLLRDGKEPFRTVAVFRRDYYVQQWSYQENILTPLNPKDVPLYDALIATGECEGFKITDDGRIRAMLLRLLDSERPVERETRDIFADFLSSRVNKVLKYAQADGQPAYILVLRDAGAIPEEELPKLRKKLAASKDQAFSQLAQELDAPVPAMEEPMDSRVEKTILDRLRKLNAKGVLMKYNLMTLPDIPLAGSDETAPKEYLQLLLAEYISHPYILSELADSTAAKLDRTALRETLLALYEKQSDKTRKAIIPAVCRYADGATVSKLYYEYAANKWTEDIAVQALLVSDTREAMLLADKRKRLNGYAEMRGTDAETLRDTVLADFGLDEDGKKVYDLGGNTVTVTLAQDLTLSIFDANAGKVVKSIPKKGADPEKLEAVKANFAEMKKNVKKVVKGRCDRLFEQFLSGETRTAEQWQKSYFGNPVLRQAASLIVWSQNGKTFTLRNGAAIDSGEQPYAINSRPIKVAHPMEMKPEDVAAWQKYFNNHGIKQPFAQVWEPVIHPEDVGEDRYSSIQIPAYRFKGQEKHGVEFNFSYEGSYLDILFSGCRLDYDPWGEGGAVGRHSLDLNGFITLGKFTFKKYTRQVNHIVALLDKWTIYGRILKDDASVVTMLDSATLAQVMQYLNLAIDNGKTNVTAELLNYKNERFPDFDPLAEFTLEDL